jgi:hypothetical protein
MPRQSRNPDNRAAIHRMSGETQYRYERMKDSATGVGSRTARDPWSWNDADANDVWPGRALTYNPNAWPPPPKVDA